MIEGKKILLTGASGFLGSSISNELSKKNRLFVLGRRKPPNLKCHFIKSDFRKLAETTQLPSSMDYIIHLSAISGKMGEKHDEIFAVNTVSTLFLLEYARRIRAEKFVFVSTGSVYGYHKQARREGHKIEFERLDPYSYSKAIAELLVQQYSSCFTTIIVRPFYPYGPGQGKGKFIPQLIEKIQNKKPIFTFNQGKHPRLSLIHISDFTKVFLKVLELKKSCILNVANEETMSVREISEVIAKHLDKGVVFLDNKDKDVKNRIGSIERMSKLLDFNPSIKFLDALSEML